MIWETMTLDVEELREAGDGALLIATLRGRGRESGAEAAVRSGWTFRFAGNSVTEIRMHPSVDAALERALGS